jgi:hypothetical protein
MDLRGLFKFELYVTPAIKSGGTLPVGLYLIFSNATSDFSRGYKRSSSTDILIVFQSFSRRFFSFMWFFKIIEK